MIPFCCCFGWHLEDSPVEASDEHVGPAAAWGSNMRCIGHFFRRPWPLHLDLLQVRGTSSGWQVSSHGRVRSCVGRVSFGTMHASGYRRVRISGQPIYVHRLVAAAFLGPLPHPNCWQVNHLDLNPSNNCVANLQYATPAENQVHAWATNPSRQASAGKAVLWRSCGEESWTFCSSHKQASKLLGVRHEAISKCCHGLQRKSQGNGTWYEFRPPPADQSLLLGEVWQSARYPGDHGRIENLSVSNHGRVAQDRRHFTGASYGTRLSTGYHVVIRAGRTLMVHRLVAATFLGDPASPDHEVNHKDADPGNNHVQNLEYVTRSENMKHSWQLRPKALRKSPNCKAVQARLIAEDSPEAPWLDFDSIVAASAHTGVHSATVSRICRGLQGSASWEFRFSVEEQLPGEEWRPVVLEGARRPAHRRAR